MGNMETMPAVRSILGRSMERVTVRLSAYFAAARLAFLKLLAYRLRYFTGIITYLLFVSVNYFVWKAVYESAGQDRINGFLFGEIVTYISVGWIARSLYFSNVDEEIGELVRTGQIAMYLLRPVHFHVLMIAEALGGFAFRLLFFTFPIAIVLLIVFPIAPPVSLVHGLFFLLATFGSFYVFAEINFLVGLLCFSLKSVEGIARAKYFFIQLTSGLLLPFAFFPDKIRWILEALPFRFIAATPLEMYLGKIPESELLSATFSLFMWGVALTILCELFWRRAFRSLSIQGG